LVSTYDWVSKGNRMSKKEMDRADSTPKSCSKTDQMAVKDALEVLNGRWKLKILISLFAGTKRFKQIAHDVEGISDKMLSKELKDLEVNQLVKRTVYDTFPPTVEYAFTEHAKTLKNVIDALKEWGFVHRKKIMGQ
jgi:DNA-binding HxlR family transcriptional regulator